MISAISEVHDALAGSYVMRARAESWLSGRQLDDDIPVADGELTVDRTARVPESLSLSVPIEADGVSYDPTGDPEHPLAPYGQRLRISVGIELGPSRIEWVALGWFLITDASVEGHTVAVRAAGLLQLIDEARLVSPFQPTGTFSSTLRKLIEPALTARISPSLADRAVPAGMSWDEDRLGAVYELLDAWPADAYVTEDGYLTVVPAADPISHVLHLNDGASGTLVDRSASTTRDGGANVVVARGQTADGAQVQGAAYDTSGGPLSYGGDFNPLPVPYFYSSPLLTTVAQANAAARTVLARLQRASRQELGVEAVPNPLLRTGDRVLITSTRLGLDTDAVVEVMRLPLAPGGGPMRLAVRPL